MPRMAPPFDVLGPARQGGRLIAPHFFVTD